MPTRFLAASPLRVSLVVLMLAAGIGAAAPLPVSLPVSRALAATSSVGTPAFPAEQPFLSPSSETRGVDIADVTGDDTADDIVTVDNGGQGIVYVHSATAPRALPADQRLFGGPTSNALSVKVANVNQDTAEGKQLNDIIVGTSSGQNAIYLNKGGGNFDHDTAGCVPSAYTLCFALGEKVTSLAVDRDHRIFAGTESGKVLMYRYTNGALAPLPPIAVRTSDSAGTLLSVASIAVGNINNAGADDIAVGAITGQVLIYTALTNPADQYIREKPLETNPNTGDGADAKLTSLALGQIDDAEGYLDIVVGKNGGQSAAYLITKSGGNLHYDAQEFGGPNSSIKSVALADLNLDGRADIVAGVYGGQSAVYLQRVERDSLFAKPEDDSCEARLGISCFGTEDKIQQVVTADVDRDGYRDIVAVGQNKLIYWNKGLAFHNAASFGGNGTGLAVGDLNDDNVPDVAVIDTQPVGGQPKEGVTIYRGNGDGTLTQTLQSLQFYATDSGAQAVQIAPLDCDAKADLVVLNAASASVLINQAAPNVGKIFKDPVNIALNYEPRAITVHPRTVDPPCGSTRPAADLIVANTSGVAATPPVVPQNGSVGVVSNPKATPGDFSAVSEQTFPVGVGPRAVAAGFLDDTGNPRYLDVVVANTIRNTVTVLLNKPDPNGRKLEALPDITVGSSPQALAIGQLNQKVDGPGDNLEDVVVANTAGLTLSVMLSKGGGAFSSTLELPVAGQPTALALADFDGDDVLDLVVGKSTGQSAIYLNDGAGDFSKRSSIPFGDINASTISVVAADMEGDGDIDLVTGSSVAPTPANPTPNNIYINNAGTFSDSVALLIRPSVTSFATGDLNGDGALDLVVGGPNRIYLKNRANGLLDDKGSFDAQYQAKSVALGDLNGDGDLDIVAGGAGQSLVYLHQGDGTYSSRPFATGMDTQSIALGDMDGDGKLDIVAAIKDGQSAVYLNSGAATFERQPPFAVYPDPAGNLAVGDLDNDGDLDIVATTTVTRTISFLGLTFVVPSRQVTAYPNDGLGRFLPQLALQIAPLRSFNDKPALALGDLDGNGFLDVVVIGNQYRQSTVSYNAGPLDGWSGSFSADSRRTFGGPYVDSRGLTLGDADGNGRLDIITAGYDRQGAVYFNIKPNPSSGLLPSFSTESPKDACAGNAANPLVRCFGGLGDTTDAIATADMNGDGALDLIVGRANTPSSVYLSDGGGHFPEGESQALISQDGTLSSMLLADLDHLNGPDLIVGRNGHLSRVYLNNAQGTFDPGPSFGAVTDHVTSLAAADINGDQWLDIVAGKDGQPSAVYLNNKRGEFDPGQLFGLATEHVKSLAAADINGDQWLDVVVGKQGDPSAVYFNDGHGGIGAGKVFGGSDPTISVATADVNGDGTLDVVVGNLDQPGVVYFNDAVTGLSSAQVICSDPPTLTAACFGGKFDKISAVTVADVDRNNAPDLIVSSNGKRSAIYLNQGDQALPFNSDPITCVNPKQIICLSGTADSTFATVAADVNGDQAVDLIASNGDRQSLVYLNDGTGAYPTARLFDQGGLNGFQSTVVGDVNGDGALDLVAGAPNGNVVVFPSALNRLPATLKQVNAPLALRVDPLNIPSGAYAGIVDTGTITIPYTLSDTEADPAGVITATYSIDGGSTWRTAVGANEQTTPVVSSALLSVSSGALQPPMSLPVVSSLGGPDAQGRTVGDLNIWLNIERTPDAVLSAALVSPDGRTVQLFSGVGGNGGNLFNTTLDDQAPTMIVTGTVPFAGRFRPQAPLSAFNGAPVAGEWRLSVSTQGGLATLHSWGLRFQTATPSPGQNSFIWDTSASKFFGQSDDVIVRLLALAGPNRARDSAGGAYQRPFVIAQTPSFRARGTQIQVMAPGVMPSTTASATMTNTIYLPAAQASKVGHVTAHIPSLAGAKVYKLTDGKPIGSATRPYLTDQAGFLRGRGVVAEKEQLVALLPAAIPLPDKLQGKVKLYYTNAHVNPVGDPNGQVTSKVVSGSGVQVITVSPDNPLLLFNLTVAVEWDARKDQAYTDALKSNLRQVSTLLYTWSDGQIALGDVTIYYRDRLNPQQWENADVRIYASNRIRPNATQGGIVPDLTADYLKTTITYRPGRVRIGATWNRSGSPGQNAGDDWPRALAHELGHYLLYLDDSYLGLQDGHLVTLQGCPGPMSDPYGTDIESNKFSGRQSWGPHPVCMQTLPAQLTGRLDWGTIQTFYPWLKGPRLVDPGLAPLQGPSQLPFAVTQFSEPAIQADPVTIPDPTFHLIDRSGARVLASNRARAFIFRDDPTEGQRIIDLGRPVSDQLFVRGTQAGDQICVIDSEPSGLVDHLASLVGCRKTEDAGDKLTLDLVDGWRPNLVIRPLSARQIELLVLADGVGAPAPEALFAKLFPANTAPMSITLARQATGIYSGTFEALDTAAADALISGYIQVCKASPCSVGDRSAFVVTDYALGGNPVMKAGTGGSDAPLRQRDAPAVSSDGEVLLFWNGPDLDVGQILTVQAASSLPSVPPWANVVGHGYRITGSPTLSGLKEHLSIAFSYLPREVPSGEEKWLTIYYRDIDPSNCPPGASPCWRPLPTNRLPNQRYVTAAAQGQGLYALMSSIEINLKGNQWNSFSYPVNEQPGREVTDALRSIDPFYTTIYTLDTANPNKILIWDRKLPPSQNTLKTLEFGRGYWIFTTKDVTLRLKGVASSLASARVSGALPALPAAYYGIIQPSAGFQPIAGVPVVARVGAVVCGQGQTEQIGRSVRYSVVVAADTPATPGCGAPGRQVSFQVGTHDMLTTVIWNSGQPRELRLQHTS